MLRMLLQTGSTALINRNDYITGFTPLHMAVFVQSSDMLWELMKNGAEPYSEDNFEATFLDYARLLGNLPQQQAKNRPTLKMFDFEQKCLVPLETSTFEQQFKVEWCPYFKCDLSYIVELMLSGFTISSKDEAFRNKYGALMEQSSGDENLILAKIDDKVGYGVYAAHDFEEGDFIVRYSGLFQKQTKTAAHSYSMASGVESVVLNSVHYRNFGGMINHSKNPNAESKCIFKGGVEQAIIVAIKKIPKGTQILINYSDSYFGSNITMGFTEFKVDVKEFPMVLPEIYVPARGEEGEEVKVSVPVGESTTVESAGEEAKVVQPAEEVLTQEPKKEQEHKEDVVVVQEPKEHVGNDTTEGN